MGVFGDANGEGDKLRQARGWEGRFKFRVGGFLEGGGGGGL